MKSSPEVAATLDSSLTQSQCAEAKQAGRVKKMERGTPGRRIWFKGSIVPADQANISVLSPTAQFGLNVFEGIRCYASGCNDGQLFAFRLLEHFARLLD